MDSFPPSPIPPSLSAGQIRALIEYARKMAAYMDTEISRANDSGKGRAVLHLPAVAEGWRFVAQAFSKTYDGEF